VGPNGDILRGYEGNTTPNSGKKNELRDMAVDEHMHVLMADKGNNCLGAGSVTEQCS